MPDERFQRLPTGPVRFSKGYVGRLQQAVEESDRSLTPPAFPGAGGSDGRGHWVDPEFDELIWAEITAQPALGYDGYSWLQKEPRANGAMGVPRVGLRGDNGTDTSKPSVDVTDGSIAGFVATIETATDHGFEVGDVVTIADATEILDGDWTVTAVTDTTFSFYHPRETFAAGGTGGTATAVVNARSANMPAFDPTDPAGDNPIPVGSVVALQRGYLDFSGKGWTWLIVQGGGAATRLSRVRVTGRPFNVDGTRYYPAVLDHDDTSGPGYHEGDAVWVVQRDGGLLDTRGLSHYTATRKLATFAVTNCDGDDEERPLYCTTQKGVVTSVDFDACVAYADYVYEGEAVCDTLTIEGDDVTMTGELIGVG